MKNINNFGFSGFGFGFGLCVCFQGQVKLSPGLNIPTIPELYNPILEEQKRFGIKFEEKIEKVEELKV
jgi:hypothetical protein